MANARRRTQRSSRTTSRMAARTAGAATTAMENEAARPISSIDWQKEMRYINEDLRHLLIVTIVLFVLLFAVGFFIS